VGCLLQPPQRKLVNHTCLTVTLLAYNHNARPTLPRNFWQFPLVSFQTPRMCAETRIMWTLSVNGLSKLVLTMLTNDDVCYGDVDPIQSSMTVHMVDHNITQRCWNLSRWSTSWSRDLTRHVVHTVAHWYWKTWSSNTYQVLILVFRRYTHLCFPCLICITDTLDRPLSWIQWRSSSFTSVMITAVIQSQPR